MKPKVKKAKLWPCLVAAPLAVLVMMGVVYLEGGFFPFGDKTVSWCDMSQQVVPLLAELKDVLSGDQGIFLNHTNAGGMNYWAVFFFFLGSPLSLLVAFVEKADMMRFMNILTALKMAVSAFTCALYFARKAKKDGRSLWLPTIIGVLYAFSIYALMYYQNSIWLDEMAVFPLLMMSLDALKKKKFWPYTLTIALMVAMNYYIGFMVALFVLFRMGYYFLFETGKDKKQVAWIFILGSLTAVGLSAIAWFPSLLQYMQSARTTGILENLSSVTMEEHLNTTIPLLFSLGSVVAVLLVNACWWRPFKKEALGDFVLMLMMFIPFFIKPIDLLWHAGSYMSFPCRFAFMTMFEAFVCLYHSVGAAESSKKKMPKWLRIGSTVLAILITVAFVGALYHFGQKHLEEMTAYVETLWGSDEALKYLAIAFGICVAGYVLLYLMRRLGANRTLCLSLAAICVAAECMFSLNVYVGSVDKTDEDYQAYMELEEEIPESEEYVRLKSGTHVAYENWEGMLGTPSVAHYTSLTSENWLYMIKRLGYNAYWMKAASYGGTLFSDALLCMGYQIDSEYNAYDDSIYINDYYALSETEYCLPLGILTDTVLEEESFTMSGRIPYQEALFEALFPESDPLFTEYEINNFADGVFEWKIRVQGKQELYLDAFSAYSTKLNEPINNSLSVYVNGELFRNNYPTQTYNNILDLGEYEDEVVTIRVLKKKNVTIDSFGVYGLDLSVLEDACENVNSVNFKEAKNGFYATYETDHEQRVLLSVPYQEGYTVKVNGQEVECFASCKGFLTFVLPAGSGEISVSFVSPGVIPALIVLIATLLVTITLTVLVRKKILKPFAKKTSPLALWACKCIFPVLVAAVYIFPVIWNLVA